MADKHQKTQFVKSSVIAVAVLLAICLVCGALLALCNYVFFVSDEVRFDRAMKKIYPDFQNDSSFDGKLVAEFASNAAYGKVLSVVRSSDKTYVLETNGIGGFGGGNVTLYVAVTADAKIAGWSVKENEGQSFIGKITSQHQATWYIDLDVSNDIAIDGSIASGATMTSTAINNAINMAAYYCRNALGVGKNPEAEAKEAIIALLGDEYSDYSFARISETMKVNASETLGGIYSVENATLKYLFKGEGDAGAIAAFVYTVSGADEIAVIKDSADQRERKIIEKSDGISDDVVEKVENYHFAQFTLGGNTKVDSALVTAAEVSDTTVVYTVSGIRSGYVPSTYVLKVTVEKDGGNVTGKVTAIEISVNGFEPGYPQESDANKLATSLVGATSATVDGLYVSEHVASATESANMIAVAVKAALAEYDATFAVKEG